MPRLYLSFAPPDQEAALRFGDVFRGWGMELQPAGNVFSRETVEAADALILILSPHTSASDRVRAEVAWALQAHKLVLPVIVEKTSLLAFPFLNDEQLLDYASDPAVLKHLASALGITPSDRLVPPEIPPRRQNTRFVEEPIQLDEESAAALFFAATEFAENQVEKSIFLYNGLLRFAPDYSGGQLNDFISEEIVRLQSVWLQNLKERVFAAVKKNNLQHAGQILREMQLLEASAPQTQAAEQHLFQAQLDSLNQQIEQAFAKHEWDEIEALVQAVAGLDTEQSETIRQKVHQAHIQLLEESADIFIQAKRWEQAEKIIQEMGGLDFLSSEAARQKFREAQLGWQEDLASAAIREEQWETVERLIKDISTLNQEKSPTLRDLRLATLERLGLALVEKGQLERAEALVQRLGAIEPDNQRAEAILAQIIKARIDPFLDKTRFALSSGQWDEAISAAREALSLAPEHEEAARLYQVALDRTTCDSLYEQAVRAADADRMQVVGVLMRRIQQTCPDYGDPQGILVGQKLNADFTGFIGQFARLEAHSEGVNTLAISADGSYLMTGAKGDLATVWELPSFEPVYSFKGHEWVRSIAISPDNACVASVGLKGLVRVWSLENGKLVFQDRCGATQIAFSSDSTQLAVGTESGRVILWNTSRWSRITDWFRSTSGVNALAFSPDGSWLGCAHHNRDISLHPVEGLDEKPKNDGSSQAYYYHPSQLLNGAGSTFVFLPDSKSLLSLSSDSSNAIQIWDLKGHLVRKIHTVNFSDSLLAVSPDDSLLVTGGRPGGLLSLRDLQTGKYLSDMQNYAWGIGGITFTPDGLYLVVGDADGNVTFWGVGGTTKPAVHKGKRE